MLHLGDESGVDQPVRTPCRRPPFHRFHLGGFDVGAVDPAVSDDVLDRAGFSQEGEEHGLPLPTSSSRPVRRGNRCGRPCDRGGARPSPCVRRGRPCARWTTRDSDGSTTSDSAAPRTSSELAWGYAPRRCPASTLTAPYSSRISCLPDRGSFAAWSASQRGREDRRQRAPAGRRREAGEEAAGGRGDPVGDEPGRLGRAGDPLLAGRRTVLRQALVRDGMGVDVVPPGQLPAYAGVEPSRRPGRPPGGLSFAQGRRSEVRTRRIGSPTLFSRRATASAASASGTWAVMDGARSIRPAEARPTSCSTCSGSEP